MSHRATSKQEIPVAPHMSPDNFSVDLCYEENCTKGLGYKAAMKLEKKLFANDNNASAITDGGNNEEKNMSNPGGRQNEPPHSLSTVHMEDFSIRNVKLN